MRYILSHLDTVEAEAIHILRECAAMAERPVLLFSGGKDSIVMLRLAEKAFRPARFPFPLMHVDTGHNFPEVIEFRDRRAQELGERLIVANVEESIRQGRVKDTTETEGSRNRIQSVTLLDAIEANEFDAVIGGARRDEEKARAKERVFSFRDEFGGWEPRKQRPELWDLFNGYVRPGQHMRVFPLSNWTEFDVWLYIKREGIEVPDLYFAHEREVFERKGMILAVGPHTKPGPSEDVRTESVRFRTIGDATCTGGVLSEATTVEEVLVEIAAARITERGGRFDDRFADTAMEDRKREGYF